MSSVCPGGVNRRPAGRGEISRPVPSRESRYPGNGLKSSGRLAGSSVWWPDSGALELDPHENFMTNVLKMPDRRGGLSSSACVAAVLLVGCLLAAAVGRTDEFVLDLPGGGRIPGTFVPVAGPAGPLETIAWQSDAFAAPFVFRLDRISGVRGTAGGAVQEPRGFRCRLVGGDIIDGELRRLDGERLVIAPFVGEPLTIERGVVTSIARRQAGAGGGFVGPVGLVGWKQSPDSSWRDDAGRITTDIRNAAVSRDLGGPARARYDIVLGWQEEPELILAVAAGRGDAPDPFRFEMLKLGGDETVAMLVRQEPDGGMLEPVPLPEGEPGRLTISLFLDQEAGRLALVVPGQEVVEMTMAAATRRPSGLFRLRLISGDVRLESVRVSAWSAADPAVADPARTRVVKADGSSLEATEVSLEDAGEVRVVADGEEVTFPLSELDEILFGAAGRPARPEAEELKPPVRLVGRSGLVVSGSLVGVEAASLAVARDGIEGAVVVPLEDLDVLASLAAEEPAELPGRRGTIRVGTVETVGCLVDAAAWGGGIAWQPAGSETAAPLAGKPEDVSAVVEYVARVKDAADEGGQVEVGGIGAAVNQDADGGFVLTMLSEAGAAARDGRIQVGDRVVAVQPVEGGPFVNAAGLDLEMIMNLMRGRVGTPVSLRIQRGAEGRPKRIDLVRGLIYIADRAILSEALAAHARVAAGQLAKAGEAAGFSSLLVLRSGDVVNASIIGIDKEGIRLRTPATASGGDEEVLVPHRLVRAVELDPQADSRTISPDQFQRLLTLPRAQRDSPPTQLLRLRSGDYLRCSLESVDEEEMRFTLLGRSKQLPRAAIVRIIWLHPDEITFEDEAEAVVGDEPAVAAVAAEGLVVQGITADAGRTTILAERMEGPVIVGASPAFGKARIDTLAVDRLLIGRAVSEGDAELPFARWRLQLAPLPRALREAD